MAGRLAYRSMLIVAAIVIVFLFQAPAEAQVKNSVKISGGSVTKVGNSFHDWYCEAEPGLKLSNNGSAPPVDGFLNGIPDLSMTIPVTELNCDGDNKDKVSKLEKNLQIALKAGDNPDITFRMTGYVLSGNCDAMVTGNLTIAGVTRQVNFNVKLTEHVNVTNLQAKGEVNVLMSEYGIEPVRALFGTIVTKDQVKIEFDVRLTPAQLTK